MSEAIEPAISLSGEGDVREVVSQRVRIECCECGEPAHFRHTYLLPNARHNPDSSAYGKDDCSWCADEERWVCRTCPEPKVDGYKSCSRFECGPRFAHMFLYWKTLSTTTQKATALEAAP